MPETFAQGLYYCGSLHSNFPDLVWALWILLSLQYALQQKPSENFKEQDYSKVLQGAAPSRATELVMGRVGGTTNLEDSAFIKFPG